MRHAVHFIVVFCCALGLCAATSPAQAGPKEDCERGASLRVTLSDGDVIRLHVSDQLADVIIRGCSQVIRRDRKAGWAYLARGAMYYGKGEYQRAIADYSKSIEIDQSADTYYERASIYHSKGDFERAIADYSKVIRLAPDRWSPLSLRGDIYQAKGGP